MTYAKNNLIQASDFNSTIVGTSTATTDGLLNSIWAVGVGSKGYGQPAVPQVTANNTITFGDWANVVNKTSTIASHQGTAITAIANTPASGSKIEYFSAVPTNISTVTTTGSRLGAAAQGTTATTTSTATSSWQAQMMFAHTATFSSGDAARYFFNSGGQLALSFSSPSGSGINGLMNTMAAAAGTIVLSSLDVSGGIKIAGTIYSGTTQVNTTGSAGAVTVGTTTGYYALTGTANTQLFRIGASGSPSGYTSSYITVNAKTNGAQGSNGDTGSTITFYTLWDEVPNGLYVSSGTATALTVRYPSTSYLANTWGAVSVSSSFSGS